MKVGDILIKEDKVTVKMKKLKTDVLNEGDVFTFSSEEWISAKRVWGGKSAGICCCVGTDSALGRLQGTRLWETGGVC